MRKILAILLLILYTFSFSTEVIAIGMDNFNTSTEVTIKKTHCKKQKSVNVESEEVPTTISTGRSQGVNLQVINVICVTSITPHFSTHTIGLIPFSDTLNSSEISDNYDSPSLLCDPFPPRA
ncbi:hypothetical protein WJR50_33725 [Catalinimonas sp. 4WD22]|uniref:hypothetical protein n=1 Tax=Catalinimonas locisalis TaxID=3133978 RepID=UPI0031013876